MICYVLKLYNECLNQRQKKSFYIKNSNNYNKNRNNVSSKNIFTKQPCITDDKVSTECMVQTENLGLVIANIIVV